MSRLIKPRQWVFNPDLVAPEWQWFWDHCLGASVLNEGAGQFNIHPKEGLSGVLQAGVSWSSTRLGSAIDMDGVSGNYVNLEATEFQQLSVPFSLIITAFVPDGAVQPQTLQTGDWADSTGNYTGASIRFDTSGANRVVANYGDGGSPSTINRRSFVWNNVLTLDEIATYGVTVKGSTTADLFIDGVDKGNPSTSGTGGPLDPGNQNGRLGEAGVVGARKYLMFAVLNRALTAEQHRQIARDPFGPFRMPVGFRVGVPVSGFVNLNSSISAAATLSSGLSRDMVLNATIAGVSALTSTLAATKLLNSSISGASTLVSALSRDMAIDSTIAGTASLACALAATKLLDSSIFGASSLAASLDAQSGLYSTVAALSTILAELDPQTAGFIDLDSIIAGVSAITSALSRGMVLDSSITGTSTIAASIDSQAGLNSIISAISSATSEIGCVVNIDGTILSSSTVSGAISLIRSLDSLITGTSTVAGELNRLAGLTVVIAGVSTILAEITGEAPEVRGFIFPANAAQSHAIVDNAAQSHTIVDNAAQSHILVNNQFPNP